MSDFTIRVSTLSSYFDCPRRAIARTCRKTIFTMGFILNEIIQGVAPAVGTGVHAGAANMLSTKIITGDPGKLDDANDAAIDKFRMEIQNGVQWDDTTNNMNTAEKQILILTKSYYYEVQPKIQPTQCEKKLTADLGDGFTLSGHADVFTDVAIRDTKTGTRVSDCQAQLGGYSLLAKSNGMPKQQAFQDFLQRVALRKPYPGAREFEYKLRIAELVAHNVMMRMKLEIQNFLQTKEAWRIPANPMSILCSRTYCSAYSTDFCDLKKENR